MTTAKIVERKPRRQYKKGLAKAEQFLVELAANLHSKQVATRAKADGTRSTDIMSQAVELSKVSGVGTAKLTSTLADYFGDFGEHRSSSNLLEEVVQFYRGECDSVGLAEALRRLSLSYDRQDLEDLSRDARREARSILTQQLQNPALLAVFESLVRDEVLGELDDSASVAGTCIESGPWPGEPLRGEVYWAHLPQFPNDPHQPRPALVVSSDRQNARGNHVSIVPLTKRFNGHRFNLQIPAGCGRLDPGGAVQCNRLSTVEKTFLRGNPMCRLPEEFVDEVLRRFAEALRIGPDEEVR